MGARLCLPDPLLMNLAACLDSLVLIDAHDTHKAQALLFRWRFSGRKSDGQW